MCYLSCAQNSIAGEGHQDEHSTFCNFINECSPVSNQWQEEISEWVPLALSGVSYLISRLSTVTFALIQY